MSALSIRLPESLHEKLRELAERENVSMNQLVTLALAEKIAALTTEEYLSARAERGTRERFEAAMTKVGDVEADEADRLG